MALHKTSHDGLSRCDQNLYSNIYDARQHPGLKKAEASPVGSISKDTIEINRNKIKEEALSSLRHSTTYTIAQNGFMRVGKYLFVAMTFPPYFLLYRIPKLVFAVIIPTFFNFAATMMGKMNQKIKKPLETVVHRLSQTASYMQVFARILIQPVARLYFEAKQAFKRMQQQCIKLFQAGVAYSLNLLTLPIRKGKEVFKAIGNGLNRLKEQIVDYTKQKTMILQEGMKQIPHLFLGWGSQLIQKFNVLALPLKNKLGDRYHSIQLKADVVTEWVFKQVKYVQSTCKGVMLPIISFCQKELLPRWEKMKATLREKSQRTMRFLKEKHRKALAYLEEKQEKLKKLSYPQWVDQIISSAWMKWLPGSIQRMIYNILHHPSLKFVGQAVFSLYSLLSQGVLHLVNGFLLLAGQLSGVIGGCYRSVRDIVRVGWGYVAKILAGARRFSLYYSSRLVYYLIFTAMVLLILFSWGVGLIAQMATQLLAKLPLPEQETK